MNIKELPFFYKSHSQPGNGGYPDILPFNLYFDDELNMFRQRNSPFLKEILNKIYLAGSLVEGSLSNESGKVYLEKTLMFITQNIEVRAKKILEIGCGDGTMLIELQKIGADVLGIEPGNHVKNKHLKNIKIIRDFFPSNIGSKKFDIIFHFGVLEHIDDFLAFLLETKKFLNETGKMIICIPNCEPYLENGDISIFTHEHYSYFTRNSFSKAIERIDMGIEKMEIIEGAIIAIIGEKSEKGYKWDHLFETKQYFDKVIKLRQKIEKMLKNYQNNDVAIYAPGRALNFLYKMGINDVRIIDDSTELHGKYLPFFTKPIENYNDLIEHPPKCILIFSWTFGEKIKKKCELQKEFLEVEIISLNDI